MAQKIVPDFESYKKMDHQSSSWVGHLNTILASREEKGVGILSNQSSKSSNAQGVAREDVEALGWSIHYLQ